jgi:signal transduction histidine kinase
MTPAGWIEQVGKARRRPFSGWFLLGLFLLLLLLVLNTSLFLTYRQVRGTIEEELSHRLLGIASTAAAGISPAAFEDLCGDPSGPAHRPLRALLQRVRQDTDLGEIYLFDTSRRQLLDADLDRPAGYENPALELHFGAATAALAGVAATSELYRVGQVYLKTAFAPVIDQNGEVLGAIGVEGGSGFFRGLWRLRRQVLLSGAVGIAAVLALALFFGRLLRSQAIAERALRETSALAAAGELAAILAHEIRNPLAIISARAERVQSKIEGGKPAGEVLEWFAAIPREVERLNRVLTQYLSFARPADLATEAAEIGPTLDAALSLLAGDLARKGIALVREDAQAAGARVAMAPAALHQVLLNLLLNARDAMPDGGQIEIGARRGANWLTLRIADTGMGMSREQLRNAFKPFYTSKSRGSGLGLSVVRSMLDLYGGRVDVASQVGRGTTFTLWIKVAPAA